MPPELYAVTKSGMSRLNNIKKKMGRPAVDTAPVTVRMERGQLNQLDAWREAQEDQPGRPEAIRRLVEKGLRG